MKQKKNDRDTSYNIEILQTIIDGLNEKNKELESEVERLRNEIAETNDVNIKQDEDDENYRNLVQLNTLLMVLQNMVIAHCDNSPLGQAVGKAIKKYQITMAKSLLRRTMYIRDEDRDDWKDDEDDFEKNEWDEEKDC